MEGEHMPAYEYSCRDCNQNFTVNLSIQDHGSEQVHCPNCKGANVGQVMVPFAAVTSKKS
jgi:putative FmdB family regulatory protein